MKYASILTELIENSGLSIGEITRRMKDEKGVKVDRSYISKLRSGDSKPPSDEITLALSEVLGVDPIELLWASTIDRSHPEIQRGLMLIDKNLMMRGLELEKKYPISDDMDEVEVDKYIESIPEYREYYVDVVKELEKKSIFKEETETYSIGKRVPIKIIGTVAAGPNGLAYEDHSGFEWTDEDDCRGGNYFYLRVKGDSMIGDGIMPGDLALIMETPNVEYGEIAVVIVNGEEGTLKRVYKKEDSIVLQSSNPAHPPRIFKGDELNQIRIVGKVKQTIRRY